MKRRKHCKPLVQDDTGHFIGSDLDTAAAIRSHFHQQFNGDLADGLEPFQGQPRELNHPITVQEVTRGFQRLNNGRACRPDNIPGELLKYGGYTLYASAGSVFNNVYKTHKDVKLGIGTLIPLQKPWKAVAPPPPPEPSPTCCSSDHIKKSIFPSSATPGFAEG